MGLLWAKLFLITVPTIKNDKIIQTHFFIEWGQFKKTGLAKTV